MVRQAGGVTEAMHLRDRYVARAHAALGSLPDNYARSTLADLPGELFNRP